MSDFPPASVPEGESALTGLLTHLGQVVSVLDLDHLDRLTGEQLLTQLGQVAGVVRAGEAVLAAFSAEVADRSDPARGNDGLAVKHNYQRPSHLIEVITGVSSAAASRLIRVGQRTCRRQTDAGFPLPPLFPVVGEAFRQGLIGVETAEVITRELSLAAPRAEVEHLTIAERTLVSEAVGAGWRDGLPMSADLVGIQARQWRDRLDEDGIEPNTDKAFQKRDFWIARAAKDGLVKFGGQVTVDVGAKLHALLDAVLNPKTADRYDPMVTDAGAGTADGTGGGAGGTGVGDTGAFGSAASPTVASTNPDTDNPAQGPGGNPGEESEEPIRARRTAGQQRADVFASMIDALARSADAPSVTGAAPTVVVTVNAEVIDSKSGTGQIVGVNAPVAASTITQILCDASIIPVFIDPDGTVVALGNDQRGFNRSQRMGMIARDGPTCGMPDCQIPATGCEAHHVVPHAEGGPTHIDNGVLFCWFHHRMVDTGVFTVTMVNGKPKVTIAEWIRRKPYFQ
ncbi:HNH endonuclease signature motif containing protein [Mycetocola zhujimingii]|uniref:HNH endonuclease signature motif containing protein n=1 Tax=Mycetocola zhujimingii TaxID=2079792 RepID=UPI0013C4466C|nr:HNH endonuclease signature motif containing protein [Mycetocola zhujimingii]